MMGLERVFRVACLAMGSLCLLAGSFGYAQTGGNCQYQRCHYADASYNGTLRTCSVWKGGLTGKQGLHGYSLAGGLTYQNVCPKSGTLLYKTIQGNYATLWCLQPAQCPTRFPSGATRGTVPTTGWVSDSQKYCSAVSSVSAVNVPSPPYAK